MGIRCTQVIGLSERATLLVQGEQVLLYQSIDRRLYPSGGEEEMPARAVFGSTVKTQEAGEFGGMFGEPYPLHSYRLPSGEVLTEKVQAEPWASGPCIFLALTDEAGAWIPESLWTEEEINTNI